MIHDGRSSEKLRSSSLLKVLSSFFAIYFEAGIVLSQSVRLHVLKMDECSISS